MKINNARFVGSHAISVSNYRRWTVERTDQLNEILILYINVKAMKATLMINIPRQLNLSCLLRTKTRNKRNKWNTRNDQN